MKKSLKEINIELKQGRKPLEQTTLNINDGGGCDQQSDIGVQAQDKGTACQPRELKQLVWCSLSQKRDPWLVPPLTGCERT